MSLSANTVFEIRTDGNDANGGGFVTGATGTDRSQQTTPHVTIDGATITATVHTLTSVLTLVGYTVSAADIGNLVNISGGTMTPGHYQITNIDLANNRWTLDRFGGTAAQTGTGRMGGAIASIGQLGAAVANAAANTKAFIRSGTYTLTSSTPNVSGGVFSNTTNISCQIFGYSASGGRTDLSVSPIIDVGAITGVTVFDLNNAGNNGVSIVNATVDGQGNSNIVAFDLSSTGTSAFLCLAIDCTTGFALSATAVKAIGCKASGCGTGFAFSGANLTIRCWADGCTNGFVGANLAAGIDCVASDCTTPFDGSGNGVMWLGCTADGATGNDGFSANALGNSVIACVATNSSLYGIDFNASNTFGYGNATYLNTSGAANEAANGQTRRFNAITLSADPYENAGSDDYRPNAVAGGGLLLRGTGVDVFGQTDGRDVGAVQHSGGGGPRFGTHGVGPSFRGVAA